MACPNSSFQLADTVTIDRTTPNSFLDLARTRCTELELAPRTNDSLTTAVDQCLLADGGASIVGHGGVGIIGTGCGDTKGSVGTFLDATHLGPWTAATEMTSLTLVACHTGGGAAGAELVFELSKATGVPVKAPTGFVFIGAGCDDFYLDDHVVWQEADGVLPATIEPVDDPDTFDPEAVHVVVNSEFVRTTLSQVISFDLHRMTNQKMQLVQGWSLHHTRQPLTFAQFDRPLLRGLPAAFVTGTIEMTFLVDTKEVHRTFRIYNDRLLQDATYPQVCYRVNVRRLLGI